MNKKEVSINKDVAKEECLKYFKYDDQLAADVFLKKYALKDKDGNLLEQIPSDMHKRLVDEFYRIESKYDNPVDKEYLEKLFDHFRYIVPQGSPMFGIGNDYHIVSLGNCYVTGNTEDSYGGIMAMDQDLVQLSKRRAGVGIDISHIRPIETPVANAAITSTGIIPFMERFSNSIREVGQCIAHDQRVLIKDRGYINIENVNSGDYVWTKEGWVKVLNVYCNGLKNVYEVTSKCGYEIITTDDHLYQSSDGYGNLIEKKLNELKIGDNIVLCIGTNIDKDLVKLNNSNYINVNNKPSNCELPEELNEEIAYMIGYAYGDGYVINKNDDVSGLEFSCSNDYPKIKEKLINIIKNNFNYDVKVSNGCGDLEILSIYNKTIIKFLEYNNILKEKSKDIVFPDKIKESPSSVQQSFIAGYFDADGCASSAKKAGYTFSSISKTFLKDVHQYLISFGIQSKLSVYHRTNLNWNDLYRIHIVGASAQEKFRKYFNDISIKVNATYHISKQDCWITPFTVKSFNIKRSKYNYVSDKNMLSLRVMNKLINDGEVVNNKLLNDSIKSIKKLDKQVITFDLELESEHLFLCNGYYVHNSNRRGALMTSISIKHPEAENFIDAKLDKKKVTGANISVKITNEFMDAVINDKEFVQQFPIDSDNPIVTKTVNAKKLWNKLIENNHKSAEPGILFWDTIINESVADCYKDYGFRSHSVNPCSELVLPIGDSCRLLVTNLYHFVKNPFTPLAQFDFKEFANVTRISQRMMDNLIDLEKEKIEKIINKIENDPEPIEIKLHELNLWKKVYKMLLDGRRTGHGTTSIGDVIAALGMTYSSDESIEFTNNVFKTFAQNIFIENVNLAKERGHFPIFNYELEKNNPFVNRILDSFEDSEFKNQLIADYKTYGRRNISESMQSPCGSLGIVTQTTSGIEPVFSIYYKRRRKLSSNSDIKVDFIDDLGDKWEEYNVIHPRFKEWYGVYCSENNIIPINIELLSNKEMDELIKLSPYYKATANDLNWEGRVKLQGTIQKWISHSISSTVNLPSDVSVDVVDMIYKTAHKAGCKGITIYRDGCRDGVLITSNNEKQEANIFKENHAPKRGKSLPCEIMRFVNKGEKWIGFLGLLHGKPYEIFTGPAEEVPIPSYVHSGHIVKEKNGDDTNIYNFVWIDKDGFNQEFKSIARAFNREYQNIGRMVSAILRHGMPLKNVLQLIDKLELENEFLTNRKNGVKRMLKKYIADGTTLKGIKCPECGSTNMIFKDGCDLCADCGYTKCG